LITTLFQGWIAATGAAKAREGTAALDYCSASGPVQNARSEPLTPLFVNRS